ncbi:MAG: zinc dependent phospholipase C family protein [Ferruginibacter sp.]
MKSIIPGKVRFIFIVVIFFYSGKVSAYSVLTHEAIVDALWEKSIRPLLKEKYPGATDSLLKEAHAYVYGGAIAPDMGYFPMSNPFFTDLIHYVRSGDFVNELLTESADVNEYAFALGFLCHYMADRYGHFLGTNQCVPIVYPKIKKKFGNIVTYEENKVAHKRMEFSFDVLEIAKGNYASEAYHDFIGFKVSRPLLERAFSKIYGMDINKLFNNLNVSIETFRWTVTSLFPVLTRAAWVTKKKDILKTNPTITSRNFRYKMNRSGYAQEFGKPKPGILAYPLSWLIRVLPKVGPLASLKIKNPGAEAEKQFIKSFDTVINHCQLTMKFLSEKNVNFTNIDFDTGNNTSAGEYGLADKSYEKLLLRLNKQEFEHADPELEGNVISFFQSGGLDQAHIKNKKERRKISKAIAHLQTVAAKTVYQN